MQSIWREDLKKGVTPFQFILFTSRSFVWLALGAFVATILTALLEAGTSYVFKLIINTATSLTSGSSPQALWHVTFLYIGVFTLELIMYSLTRNLNVSWINGARASASYALSSYVTLHDTQFFSNRFAGSVSSKISGVARSTRTIINIIIWNFTTFFVILVASIFFLWPVSHMLTYILVGWTIVIIPLNVSLSRRRTLLASLAQGAETVLTGSTVDILSNMSAVQDYTNRALELLHFKKLILDRREKGLQNARYGELVIFLNSFVQILFIAGLLSMSVYLFSLGKITPGDIAMVLSLVVIIRGKLSGIGSTLTEFAEGWGEIKEGLEDILIEQDIPDAKNAKPLAPHASSIAFENASFAYGGDLVFDNLSLTIPSGQKVGLVGRSGAGKSTLVKLLLRHYDLTDGSIRIGDENIASVTKDSLRRAIAVVPQDPLLFHRSIRDNIAYGKPGATEEEIIHAAKLAEAHEFIEKVTGGYSALVGERGVKLSGGQRQRIVIARAILKDAPILLLDEATSALDSESEGAVQKALFTLMEHRTVIAIAHRLSTLRAMDRIIVMDEGTIIEDGSHDELLAKEGVYAMLWNHQAGGFIEE